MPCVNLDLIKHLLPILREHGVSHVKMEGLELSFGVLETRPKEVPAPPLASEEAFLPPDLKADDLFNHDKVLHWSGSGESGAMPLTGEEALAAP